LLNYRMAAGTRARQIPGMTLVPRNPASLLVILDAFNPGVAHRRSTDFLGRASQAGMVVTRRGAVLLGHLLVQGGDGPLPDDVVGLGSDKLVLMIFRRLLVCQHAAARRAP